MRVPSRLILVMLAIGAAAAPTMAQTTVEYSRVRALANFTEHGVRVDLAIERDSAGRLWLAGTYTPIDPRSYLYSKDLPPAGIQGLGRPTVLTVLPGSALKVTGPAVANQPVTNE